MNSKFIKSTVILIIGGFISKILGMFTKIISARVIGIEGIGLYMLIMPTFLLFITLCQLGLPIAISKLVSEDKRNNKRLILSILPITLLFDLILIGILILIAPFISKYLLQDSRTYYPLISIGLTLPFIAISNIVRSYFFGKEKMFPHIYSGIIEQIIRIILIATIIPSLFDKGLHIAITGIVLTNIISEGISTIILFIHLPKNMKITKKDIIPLKEDVRDLFNIGIPSLGSRLIGSIGYFLEPIILTATLIYVGYSNNYIITEYGIITGYVIQLLLIPSFFSQAISYALLPVISKNFSNNRIEYSKNKVKQALLISFCLGLIVTIVIMIKPYFLLKFIYNTNNGSNYLRFMAPIFLLFYIQTPLTSVLQAIGKAKNAMYDTVIGIVVKTLLLFLLSLLGIGMYGLIIAILSNIIIVTILHYRNVKNYLK